MDEHQTQIVVQTATAVPQEYATYATHSVSLIPQPEPQTLMMPQVSQQILTANTSSGGGGVGGKAGRAKKGECNTDLPRSLNRILASQFRKLGEAPKADQKIIDKLKSNDPGFPTLADEPHDMSPVPSDIEVSNALSVLKRKITSEGKGAGDRFDAFVMVHTGHNDEFQFNHVCKEQDETQIVPSNAINKAIDFMMELFRSSFPSRLKGPPRKRDNRKRVMGGNSSSEVVGSIVTDGGNAYKTSRI